MTFNSYVSHKSQLLRRFSIRQGPVKNGFNLIELMIVVSITGMLSAVAIPQYQNVKNKADANIKVSEAIGFARECAVFQIDADPVGTTVENPGGNAVTCGGDDLAQHNILSRIFTLAPGQTISCLNESRLGINEEIDLRADITVSRSGALSCAFLIKSSGVLPPSA